MPEGYSKLRNGTSLIGMFSIQDKYIVLSWLLFGCHIGVVFTDNLYMFLELKCPGNDHSGV